MAQCTLRVLLLLAAAASAAEMTLIEQQLQKMEGHRDVARETLRMVYDNCAPLKGLQTTVKGVPITVPNFPDYKIGPCMMARHVARTYMKRAGLSYNPDRTFHKVDKEFAQRVAEWFNAAKHDPKDPAVAKAYAAMIREVVAQWEVLFELTNLHVEWITEDMLNTVGNPYDQTPRMCVADIVLNNHFYCFPTEGGFGSDEAADTSGNPLEEPALDSRGRQIVIDGKKCCANDIFRIVHDYFGHVKEGCGFRADGEDNAWRQHAAMFSAEALPAVTAETRGQNSWVNFGPKADQNKNASQLDTQYADQKTVAAPAWVIEGGMEAARFAKPVKVTCHALHIDSNLVVDLSSRPDRPAKLQLQRQTSLDSTDYASSHPSSPESVLLSPEDASDSGERLL